MYIVCKLYMLEAASVTALAIKVMTRQRGDTTRTDKLTHYFTYEVV